MKRLLLLLLLLLPSLAWAQKPPINSVAGPTTSRQFGSIITDAIGDTTNGKVPLFAGCAGGVLIFSGGAVPSCSTVLPGGLSMTGTYSTVSTSALNVSPDWTFSSTANAISAISLSPTMTPAGASAGNVNAVFVAPVTTASGSINFSTLRGLVTQVTASTGYTGTITTVEAMRATYLNLSGIASPTATGFVASGLGNGGTITSGAVHNRSINVELTSASPGAGGTIVNDGLEITLSTGSGAGTTTNRGIYITGNGGTGGGGTTTNYAIYSDSTAASSLTGALSIGGTFQVTQASPAAADACTAGQIVGDANYLYTCSASGAWKRVAVTGGY